MLEGRPGPDGRQNVLRVYVYAGGERLSGGA